ncbi:MAG: hypothetical protein WCO55_03925 [Candidatus Falkowbacteria bacterium]
MLLQQEYKRLCQVMTMTAEHFGVDIVLPSVIPDEWQTEFDKKSKVVLSLGSHHLVIMRYLNTLKIELVSNAAHNLKDEWALKVHDIDFVTWVYGSYFSADKVFDLTKTIGTHYHPEIFPDKPWEWKEKAPTETKAETIGQFLHLEPEVPVVPDMVVEPNFGQQPVVVEKRRNCPHCNHRLTAEEVADECCSKCEEYFYVCPRCSVLLKEDPDDLEECPKCHKTYLHIDCPSNNCQAEVWIDAKHCPECKKTFERQPCPSCEKPIIFSESQEECPHCGNTLYICPRCHCYIDEDPDDVEECPKCHKTLRITDCPGNHCRADVYADATECPECHMPFDLKPCPSCEKPIIFSENLDECPYCDTTLYICPFCHEYIDEDPDDADECPKCKASLRQMDCPNCGDTIFADYKSCPACHTEFDFIKCPVLGCEEMIILHQDVESCPHCDFDITYTKCPHCDKAYYVVV